MRGHDMNRCHFKLSCILDEKLVIQLRNFKQLYFWWITSTISWGYILIEHSKSSTIGRHWLYYLNMELSSVCVLALSLFSLWVFFSCSYTNSCVHYPLACQEPACSVWDGRYLYSGRRQRSCVHTVLWYHSHTSYRVLLQWPTHESGLEVSKIDD